jgi:SAM-dependent methyltransferase
MTIAPPPGSDSLPTFDAGWIIDDARAPFLRYLEGAKVNWSDELEELHEEASQTHFLDQRTRRSILRAVGQLPADASIVDVGCSSGYLLADLRESYPEAKLVGVDLVAAGLPGAHERVPTAQLLQADACALPIADESVDAVVSANLLEHIPDDVQALREMYRVLRPGSPAALVVPAGPGTYDYYDRFLGHERRYARGELAGKARAAGFEVIADTHIASLLFLPFWLVKKWNRRRYRDLDGDALKHRVASDIARTSDSAVGRLSCGVEDCLRLNLPFGIRGLVVLRRAR